MGMVSIGLASTSAAWGQEEAPVAEGAPASGESIPWDLQSSVDVGETFTDNHDLTAQPESDAITSLSARVRAISVAGPVRGSFDYRGTGLVFAKHSSRNDVLHQLSAGGTADLVPGQAYLDGKASVTRQSSSAFGSQAASATRRTRNVETVKTLSLSPYVRGRLLQEIDYEARAGSEVSQTRSFAATNSQINSMYGRLGREGAAVGWFSEVSYQSGRFSGQPRTEDGRFRAGANLRPNTKTSVGVSAGYETGDLDGGGRQSEAIWGTQLQWRPSPLTSLSGDYEHRPFVETHTFAFRQQSNRIAWGLSDTREVMIGNRSTMSTTMSAYDLRSAQLASSIPDPIQRDLQVRQDLAARNIDPAALQAITFLTAANSVRRAEEFSLLVTLPRQTLTLYLQYEESRRLDQASIAVDDLSQSSKVRTVGGQGSLSHRLTALATITATGSYRKALGDSTTQTSELKSAAIQFNTRRGRRTDLSGEVRYTVFNSPIDPYRETAVMALVTHRFY